MLSEYWVSTLGIRSVDERGDVKHILILSFSLRRTIPLQYFLRLYFLHARLNLVFV
jgi:hypothetical protein